MCSPQTIYRLIASSRASLTFSVAQQGCAMAAAGIGKLARARRGPGGLVSPASPTPRRRRHPHTRNQIHAYRASDSGNFSTHLPGNGDPFAARKIYFLLEGFINLVGQREREALEVGSRYIEGSQSQRSVAVAGLVSADAADWKRRWSVAVTVTIHRVPQI